MTSKDLRFGLVGCGRIAQRHSDLLGTGQIVGARLAAVCDIDPDRAAILSRKFGVPAYSDMDEMAAADDVDVVTVLTPSGLHAEHVLRLAPHRKDIVVEKPMALIPADAEAMIEACDAHGVRLFVVKQNRFNVPVTVLRAALEAGRFGKMVLGTVRVRWCRRQDYYDQDSWRGTWGLDGGVLANQASHHVDLLQWMMGDVESVFARSSTALANIEAEDTIVVTVKFKSGALGVIEATTAARPVDLEGSISILGSGGTVEIGGFAVNELRTWRFENEQPKDKLIPSQYSVNPPNVYGYGHQAYLEHVVNCIRHNAENPVDGHAGRKSLQLIAAIYESIERGCEVAVDEASSCRLGRLNEPVHG